MMDGRMECWNDGRMEWWIEEWNGGRVGFPFFQYSTIPFPINREKRAIPTCRD